MRIRESEQAAGEFLEADAAACLWDRHLCGGRTTKIHALCDGVGRLYALLLTGGNVHDISGARVLLAIVPTLACFLGDKA